MNDHFLSNAACMPGLYLKFAYFLKILPLPFAYSNKFVQLYSMSCLFRFLFYEGGTGLERQWMVGLPTTSLTDDGHKVSVVRLVANVACSCARIALFVWALFTRNSQGWVPATIGSNLGAVSNGSRTEQQLNRKRNAQLLHSIVVVDRWKVCPLLLEIGRSGGG